MKQQHADYQVVPYPKYRRWMVTAFRSTHHKPMIHGLLEVDVTRPRAHLREHKAKTGESLSFTAFLIACLAKAVEEHKAVQAFRQGQQALLDHYGTTRKWLNETHGSNPRLPVWKLVLEYGVGQSQARVRWADRALSTMTNSTSKETP